MLSADIATFSVDCFFRNPTECVAPYIPKTSEFMVKNFDLKVINQNIDPFDALVSSLEANQDSLNELRAARQWVAKEFYAEENKTLAALRLEAGLSQKQLAILCNLEQSHVSRYESGTTEPKIKIAAMLAKELNVSLDDFFKAWENSVIA